MGINIQMTEKEYLQQGNKKNPLGMIPRNWKILRLGDMCYNKGDYGLNAPAIDYSNNMPTYLRITDIDDNGKFRTEDIKSVDNPMAKDYYLKDGDIVFARTGATVGKTYLYNPKDGQLVYAGFLIKFSPNRDIILPYYLKIYTETNMYKNWVAVVSQRSGQPGINAFEYCSFKMLVPPIDEQKKIVAILSEWDKAIELQTKLIEKLELRKRALRQRLLTGRVRLNGYSGTWETKYLRELFVERNETENNHLPLLSITADKGVILQSESEKRDNSNEDKSKYKRICPNDIGYNTMRMWQGRSALSNIEGIVSPAYTVVTPNIGVNPLFIISIIQLPRTIYDFWSHSQGLVDDTLNCKFSNFSQVKVSIPTLKEQTEISTVLIIANKEIELAKTKLSSLINQKQGLMQQLLTGKKELYETDYTSY